MKTTTHSKTLSYGRQSAIFKMLISLGPHKCLINIKRDSYDFQSHAKISRWDGNQWQVIYSRPFKECDSMEATHFKHPSPGIYDEKKEMALFEMDAAYLIEQASFVLSADEKQSVQIVVEYDDHESVPIGEVFLANNLSPDQCDQKVNELWEQFKREEPDTDTQFIDWLKDNGYEVADVTSTAVCVQG